MLKDKKILLCVCGSIASYKSAYLTRLLVKAGAIVKIVMTEAATHFITPLSLSTLSKNPVLVNYYDPSTGEWNNHVDLGLWADILVIAPASANTIAKFAHGHCDNLLGAIYLSAKCPVLFAPAMDLDMWKHPATQHNIKLLQSYQNTLINPAYGELASGLTGEGRMAEPDEILSIIQKNFIKELSLTGKKVLVTAGPTYEAIDPVRFIGNHSSGKMGFAIAEEFSNLGAEVTLITGPVALTSDNTIKRVDVTNAAEMLDACKKYFTDSCITVMTAAVADYRPEIVAENKIKKYQNDLTLKLVKTEDILATLGDQKRNGQLLIGFALETENEEANAIKKLEAKKLDLIILNSLKDKGAGFKVTTNKITIIDRNHNKYYYDPKPKTEVAADICMKIIEMIPK